MDLHATEVTRWVDAGLSGLAFGNEHHCFVVQSSVESPQSQEYFLSTEESVLISGGIVSLRVSGGLLTLQLSTRAAQELGLRETMHIDISSIGEADDAVAELVQMVGVQDLHRELTHANSGQLALFV